MFIIAAIYNMDPIMVYMYSIICVISVDSARNNIQYMPLISQKVGHSDLVMVRDTAPSHDVFPHQVLSTYIII